MTYWILIILALSIVVIFLLAAMGVFNQVEDADDWANPDLQDLVKINLPIALFGYRRSTVDALLERLQAEKSGENPKND